MKILIIFLLFIFSCAPKVCPKPEKITESLFIKPPENVKIYGYAKVKWFKIPFKITKTQVKTPRFLYFYERSLCIEGKCFFIPFTPVDIVYGYYPDKYKIEECGKVIVLTSKDGKKIYVKGNRIERLEYSNITILYGKRTTQGYYQSFKILIEGIKINVYVEKVEGGII